MTRVNVSAERWLVIAFVCVSMLTSCNEPAASLVVGLPNSGDGALLHVAPWGSDGASGTFDEPLFTLTRAAQLAGPGDTVLLRGGVYDALYEHVYVRVEMSGAPGAPITVRSYPGERAVFDGHLHPWHPRQYGDGRSVTSPYLVWLQGDHLVWEDITFRNGVGRGFTPSGDHNVFRQIVSHHHHAHGITLSGRHNLLEYVTSHDNNSVANGGNSADGISLIHGRNETRDNVVRYALAYRNSDDGIEVWNSRDTLVEYSISFDNGIGPSGNGMGFKLGGGERYDSGTIIARFNIAFGNRGNFDTNGSTGVLMYNNTAWGGNVNYVLTQHRTNACDNEAYNNISYQPRSHHVIRGDCSVDEHNSWNLNIDDPLFNSLDPASPVFLSLSSASPAINAGIDMGVPYSGGAPDLGALPAGVTHDMLPLALYHAAVLASTEAAD